MLPVDLEELTLNAWPSLQRVLYDGWVLGFSDGYTRRANSVNPLYPSSLPLGEKVRACEAAYAARGQATVFKLSSRARHAELEQVLDEHGYAPAAAPTSVQTLALDGTALAADGSVSLSTALEDGWFGDFCHLSLTPERFHASMAGMLRAIAPAHAFASLHLDGRAVGLGLAVAERGYVGLFDIVVDATVRNQGLGRRVVTALLDWGRHQGADNAYLAVMCDNEPALHLYARLGFTEVYRYWYRVRAAG